MKDYLHAAGKKSALFYLFLHFLYAATLVGNNIWLAEWTNDAVSLNGTVDRGLVSLRLGVYGGIAGAQGIVIFNNLPTKHQ